MNVNHIKTRLAQAGISIALLLTGCKEDPQALLASAKDYLAKNDTKAAIIQIKNVLQSDPNSSEARFMLGRAFMDSGDPAGAELELRKALDLKHPQELVVPLLAKSLLDQGRAKELISELANTELSEPASTANLQMALASAYAQQGNMDLSQSSLDRALAADPHHIPALVAQAKQKAELRDHDGAMAMVDAILTKAPDSHEAWKLKGDLSLYAKSSIDDALVAYRKAVQIKPDFLAAQAAVASLLMQQGNLTDATIQIEGMQKYAPNHPRTHFLQAQLAFQKKDFKLARDLVQQVLKATPSNIQGLQLAGAVELQFNAWPQAQAYLSKALEAAPQLTLARRLLVVAYLRGGQPAKAMETLLPGLERAKVDPGLLSVAGEVYLQNGDLKKAEDYFKKASLQAPHDGRKKTALALVHLMSGPVDTAFEELQGIAVSDTGISADLALISAHLRRQEFDRALSAIDRLEKKQPTEPLASQLRARALLAKKDIPGARKSLLRALEIDPVYFPAAATLAGLDLQDKKPEVAKSRFDAVLSKDPKHVQALLALAELAARSGASTGEVAKLIDNAVAANPTDASTRLLLIDFYLRSKDVKAAASAAQEAAAALPDNTRVLNALGRTQQASGDYNQAAATFSKLVAMQPQSPLPLLHLTDAYMADGNKSGATASLRKALAIKPDLLEAQRALITLDLTQSRYDDALATARTVQKQRPKDAVGYVLEGDIKISQNNREGAITAYREGLKQMKSSEVALKLHSALLATGKVPDADRLSTTWQKENPKDAAFLFYLGDIALAHNDFSGAEKYYAEVIKLQPDSAIAYNNLAWVSAKLNREGAIGYAERANALAPNQPAFMDTLASLLSEKGEYAKALELQQKALSLQPANPQLKLNLAKIYLKGGKRELAKKELNELAKLGEKFPAQAEVAALLKGG